MEPRALTAGCWNRSAQRIPPGCSCSFGQRAARWEHVLRSAEQPTAGTSSAYARSNLKARLQKRCYKTQEVENARGIRTCPHKRWKIPGQEIVRMACNQAQDPVTIPQLQGKPAERRNEQQQRLCQTMSNRSQNLGLSMPWSSRWGDWAGWARSVGLLQCSETCAWGKKQGEHGEDKVNVRLQIQDNVGMLSVCLEQANPILSPFPFAGLASFLLFLLFPKFPVL